MSLKMTWALLLSPAPRKLISDITSESFFTFSAKTDTERTNGQKSDSKPKKPTLDSRKTFVNYSNTIMYVPTCLK